MPAPPALLVRTLIHEDKSLVTGLLATCRWRHHHLDWKEPLDLLGEQPYLVAESGPVFVGCMACPEGPPGVAWIRVLCIALGVDPLPVWEALWEHAADSLELVQIRHAASLVSGAWQRPLLETSGFHETNAVIFYERSMRRLPPIHPGPASQRHLEVHDLPDVSALDRQAFGKLWRVSPPTLAIAYRQAADATVAVVDGKIVGYQLTTLSPLGAHLARLAVGPRWQGQGIGSALVAGMLHRLQERGTTRVTLNTQVDNLASQKLYERLGFRRNGETLAVMERTW